MASGRHMQFFLNSFLFETYLDFVNKLNHLVHAARVSCDRTLMRKPILRLGIIFYWAFLHALLATFAI